MFGLGAEPVWKHACNVVDDLPVPLPTEQKQPMLRVKPLQIFQNQLCERYKLARTKVAVFGKIYCLLSIQEKRIKSQESYLVSTSFRRVKKWF